MGANHGARSIDRHRIASHGRTIAALPHFCVPSDQELAGVHARRHRRPLVPGGGRVRHARSVIRRRIGLHEREADRKPDQRDELAVEQ